MLKKIKESEAYLKFKELRANPQTKALSSLIVWLLFFVIIVVLARGMNGNVTKLPQENSKYLNISSYEYTYVNDKITIFGERYNDRQLFTINNNKYYYNGNNVYLIMGDRAQYINDFDLNILKIDLNMIDNLTSNLSFNADGEVREYIVPLSNFINLYDIDTPIDLSLANNYNIIIQKFYKDDDLYKIIIDLSNYYLFNNLESSGKLIIYLYNKNRINNFSLEYEKMLGVK